MSKRLVGFLSTVGFLGVVALVGAMRVPRGEPDYEIPEAHRNRPDAGMPALAALAARDAARRGPASAPGAGGSVSRPGAGGEADEEGAAPESRRGAGPSGADPSQGPAEGVADRADEATSPSEAGGAEPAATGRRWAPDRVGIRGAMDEARPGLRDCYEQWLRATPGAGGKLVVRFDIVTDPEDPSRGRVDAVEVADSSLRHPLLEACLLSEISALRFEAPPDGKLSVSYPLLFSSPDAGIVGDAG